ncbi:MAG: D-tyrosyl-tRNA(Tyr) deacylase [Actinobacteria bacterium RBG_16_68_21]|nr:MAG: D-tyrosyl-tRNA(Tyr) deacylase [Actinobacteria bacterium RBG_16_68_21]
MRAVIQRVTQAEVRLDGAATASIGCGLLVLVGVAVGDTEADAAALGAKVAALRIFTDPDGKMNLSVGDAGGSVIVVSQFTLLADLKRGRRPSFTAAEDPAAASRLVDAVATAIASAGIPVQSGRFGAHMEVDLVNDGPVTLVIEVVDGAVR